MSFARISVGYSTLYLAPFVGSAQCFSQATVFNTLTNRFSTKTWAGFCYIIALLAKSCAHLPPQPSQFIRLYDYYYYFNILILKVITAGQITRHKNRSIMKVKLLC